MKTGNTILTAVGAFAFVGLAAPLFAAFSGTDVFLPSVGRAAGISNWYTTVWVHNPGTVQATAQFTFLVRDQVNTSATAVTRTIAAGATVKYANAMTEIFGREGFGAIRVMSNQKLVVNSRIYARATSETDTSSKGQFFAGVPASFAIGTGQKSQLLGVFQTQPSASSAFRYNFGFVETTGQDCTVRVTPRSPTGAVLATGKSYPVRRLEQRQFQFKDEFASLSTDNARLEVEVTAGNGRVIAFGSGIANGSSDPSTFEMSFRDDLLAENASGSGTITGVTAGNGLTGGGTSGHRDAQRRGRRRDQRDSRRRSPSPTPASPRPSSRPAAVSPARSSPSTAPTSSGRRPQARAVGSNSPSWARPTRWGLHSRLPTSASATRASESKGSRPAATASGA